ncbi:MAG: HAD-IIIC family phosphatase [Pseudomonadota bacterium]
MKHQLNYPFDPHYILRKKRSIKRELLKNTGLVNRRIAIIGGSTTAEIKDILELFLLKDGIKPVFYESEYGKYYEDIMFENNELDKFAPETIYIHTSSVNISNFPTIQEESDSVAQLLQKEFAKFTTLWERIEATYHCPIIQNNFELPYYRTLGNLDFSDIHGRTHFLTQLNQHFAEYARSCKNLYINDINYLASWFGLERWYDKNFWYAYKYAMNYEAIPLLTHNIASLIKASYGNSKKCLVLDLDNTLWGGIIGDDGIDAIKLGRETAEAEAYTDFQQYIKELKQRGIILAVCSKNELDNAKAGFFHPDTILKLDDFTAFQANWNPKHENIKHIAETINIGLDSLVFVDDNPAERQIVQDMIPEVAVPDIGNNVAKYIDVLDKTGYFETLSISKDDLQRNSYYTENLKRQEVEARYNNYDEFLKSLEMVAEIKAFVPVYLERIAQLTNKTNQFNLTTKRYSLAEIEAIANDTNYISIYGRLKDKFGDNGLITIIITAIKGKELHIDLWLMSCRVLKRGMEKAMLDQLVQAAHQRGITIIYGYYYKTVKNKMVSELYRDMGFECVSLAENGDSVWRYKLPEKYENQNQLIEVIT